ncbi:MAG: ABC transporter substrate-binding protein [Bacteroidales bacterium]|nr:ABC transporter substrate-binding protein [Bacteroidales bacterium]
MRKHLLYLLVLSSYFLLHSCASPQHKNDTVAYTDDYNRTVQVPVAPQRVVSTSPAVTEIIYALGGQELLVGRTDFCTYPPEAASVESIGGISNLNVEKIVSLNPDIVISGSMIPKKSTDQLEKMGVATVHVIEKKRFDGLYENISRIGQLIGRAPQADSLNEVLRERIHTLTHSHIHALTHSSIPSIYYVVGFGPSGNFTAGGDSFINDIITMAGGRNIAEDITGWSYSLESLLTADPDYILIRREDSAAFCSNPPYSRLTAVKDHRVIGINSGLIDLQVPRNIDAVLFLSRRLAE